MDATIDLGKNVTSLLEKLADKLGVTVDKVFPWYVKQAKIFGWINLIASTLALLLFCSLGWYFNKRAVWDDGNPGNSACWLFLLFTTLAVPSIIVWFLNLQPSISAILNPEYKAVSDLLNDLGQKRT